MGLNNKKILVTGGRGFIGTHLIRRFKEKGWEGVPFDGDITNFTDVESNFVVNKDADVVVHFGAFMSTPMCEAAQRYAFDVNVTGTYNVAQAAKQNNMKFVYIASTSSYLPTNEIIKEDSERIPFTLYGFTKNLGEETAKFVDKDCLILRLCHVYGEYEDWYSIIANLIKNRIDDRPTIVHINPKSLRSWLHIFDCSNAILLAINEDLHGVYNLSSHEYRPFNDVIEILHKNDIWPIIYWRSDNDYMGNHRVDCSKLIDTFQRDLIVWKPVITLEKGIKRLVEIRKNERAKISG